jgi:hypothetical protein
MYRGFIRIMVNNRERFIRQAIVRTRLLQLAIAVVPAIERDKISRIDKFVDSIDVHADLLDRRFCNIQREFQVAQTVGTHSREALCELFLLKAGHLSSPQIGISDGVAI